VTANSAKFTYRLNKLEGMASQSRRPHSAIEKTDFLKYAAYPYQAGSGEGIINGIIRRTTNSSLVPKAG
jgi:hypothetical protein